MEYEQFRDKLNFLKTEKGIALKTNENLCSDIFLEINKIKELDRNNAEIHGIDLDRLMRIDLKRLAEDSDYASDILIYLEKEIDKMVEILGGVLK